MKKARRWVSTGTALGSALLLVTAVSPAPAAPAQAEPEGHRGFMAAKGRVTYRVYCASCHGPNAQGGGNLAQYLTVEPSDLTRLSADSDGEFPSEMLRQVIDGRRAVRGHGHQEMPVWGNVFQSSLSETAPSDGETGEARAERKIAELVLYLETIQAEEETEAEE